MWSPSSVRCIVWHDLPTEFLPLQLSVLSLFGYKTHGPLIWSVLDVDHKPVHQGHQHLWQIASMPRNNPVGSSSGIMQQNLCPKQKKGPNVTSRTLCRPRDKQSIRKEIALDLSVSHSLIVSPTIPRKGQVRVMPERLGHYHKGARSIIMRYAPNFG
jgi:hypothetical protein